MAKWGSFDFKEFKALRDRFQDADKIIDQFIREFLSEMAMRALRKIKKRTPVGNYGTKIVTIQRGKNKGKTRTVKLKGSHGRTGGQLRRNWKVGKVHSFGNSYVVEIYNNTEYAGYVEFGHRTGAELTRWVEGEFMMTISMQEIERELPRYLARRQKELLQRLLGGK